MNRLSSRELQPPAFTPIQGDPPPPDVVRYLRTLNRYKWGILMVVAAVGMLAAMYACYGYSIGIYLSWFPKYLVDAHGFSLTQMGFYASLPLMAGVAGDIAGAALGSYMVWEARNLGMSKWQMTRMAGNVGVDFLLGLIPWIGVIPDFLFRSNTRNLRIIKRHLDRSHPADAKIDSKSGAARSR